MHTYSQYTDTLTTHQRHKHSHICIFVRTFIDNHYPAPNHNHNHPNQPPKPNPYPTLTKFSSKHMHTHQHYRQCSVDVDLTNIHSFAASSYFKPWQRATRSSSNQGQPASAVSVFWVESTIITNPIVLDADTKCWGWAIRMEVSSFCFP